MMVSRAAVVLLVYFIQGSLGHAVPHSPLVGIVGGYTVDINDAPYMASVNIGGRFCGGGIVHMQFVLTTAHCILKEHHSSSDYVRVGSTYRSSGGKKISIARYIAHKNYHGNSPGSHNYNVGLVKLSTLLNFGLTIAPINLADSDIEINSGTKALLAGWGQTGPEAKTRILHQVSVTVTSVSTCNSFYGSNYFSDKVVCVSDYGAGICRGDIGGPLVYKGRAIAMAASGGNRETCGYNPGIYVKISAHLDWINQKISYYG